MKHVLFWYYDKYKCTIIVKGIKKVQNIANAYVYKWITKGSCQSEFQDSIGQIYSSKNMKKNRAEEKTAKCFWHGSIDMTPC